MVQNSLVLVFNELSSLKGSPKIVGKDFDCSRNKPLKTLEDITKNIGGKIYSDLE